MIDAEAVAVSIIGQHSLAAPDVDLADRLPCVIVETVATAPVGGPSGEALIATMRCAALAETRAVARDMAWRACEALDNSPGHQTPLGSVAHAAIEELPTRRPNESGIQNIYQFDFTARLVLRRTRKEKP